MIWSAVREKNAVKLLIDTRTSEQFIQVFTVRPYNDADIAGYEPFLAYSTAEASPQMCGLHSIIFLTPRTASIAVEALSNFWKSGRTGFVRWEQLGSDVFIHPKQEN